MASQSPSTRKQCDFTKLMMAGYDLELNNGSTQDFYVTFHGPKDTIYESGVWKVHVTLPDDYPFASPSIGFVNKVLHPNVDEASGSVCLDVINQTWTPLYSLVNVFEVFLPQLLTYPNPSDPLNSDAASLLIRDKQLYEKRVKEYVHLYANRENFESKGKSKIVSTKNSAKNKTKNGINANRISASQTGEAVTNQNDDLVTQNILGENDNTNCNSNNNSSSRIGNGYSNNKNRGNVLNESEEEADSLSEDDDEFDYGEIENDKIDYDVDEIDIDDL